MKAAIESPSNICHSAAFENPEMLLDPREYDRIRATCDLAAHMLNENKTLISNNVVDRCEAIGNILNLNDAVKVQLALAAKVHRVGELLLPKALQDKCFLDMGLDARTAYQAYPIFSVRRVCDSEDSPLYDILLNHREYLSGESFLKQGKSAGISIGARVICVATEYEELIFYKGINFRKQGLIQRNMVRNLVGKYDSDIVEALMISISESVVQH